MSEQKAARPEDNENCVTPPADGHLDGTATIEGGAAVHQSARVWQHAKVRSGAAIGAETRIGGGAYVGVGVAVGARCKIENAAQLFEGANLADGVFIGPGAILANDRYPRAVRPDGRLKEAADWEVIGVRVEVGASIGAGAVVLPGITIGSWALVGAGATVTRDVAAHCLVVGNPARCSGWICRCARPIEPGSTCPTCDYRYVLRSGELIEEQT